MKEFLLSVLSYYEPGIAVATYPFFFFVIYTLFWKLMVTHSLIAYGILKYSNSEKPDYQDKNKKSIKNRIFLSWFVNITDFTDLKRDLCGVIYLLFTELYLILGIIEVPTIAISVLFHVRFVAEIVSGTLLIFANIAILVGVALAIIRSIIETNPSNKAHWDQRLTDAYFMIWETVFQESFKQEKKKKKFGKHKHGR